MLEIVVLFLVASLVLYAVLGGADFGAGVIETLAPKERAEQVERLVGKALGPVWEANHVWLIVAVVILFVGFPEAFRIVSIAFHLPLTLLLVGVTLRGCAFTFRNYDIYSETSRRHYSRFFKWSSWLTPMALGLVAGGVMLGRLAPADAGFYAAFVASWLHPFGFAVGLFLTSLYAFTAAVFLVGETTDATLKAHLRRTVIMANVAAILTGLGVFAGAAATDFDLFGRFMGHPLAIFCLTIATLMLAPLHYLLRQDRRILVPRLIVAAIFGSVLVGWLALQYPMLIGIPEGPGSVALAITAAAAPEPTLKALAYALLGGAILMLPALAYLLYVFKIKAPQH